MPGYPSMTTHFLGHAMTDNEPRNELEAQILEAQEGHITSDDLLKTLMESQVFMPVQALFQGLFAVL